jgi:hypothetical protein
MIGVCNLLWETEKFYFSNYPDILFSPQSMHPSSFLVLSFIVSCTPPPLINFGTRFLLKGQGCNTP